AAEAVVELLDRIDPERGRLLVVERAVGLVFAPRALQRHAGADQLDQIGAGDQVIDESSGDAAGHGQSLPWPWRKRDAPLWVTCSRDCETGARATARHRRSGRTAGCDAWRVAQPASFALTRPLTIAMSA